MANEKNKPTSPQQPQPESTSTLAERLFVASWKFSGQSQDEHVAAKCLDAAETFERVRRERAGLRLAETG